MKKTLLSLLMVVMLVLALAVPAMATEAGETDALQRLINADGNHVQLEQAYTENVTVSDELYLNLNGNAITGTITVAKGGVLYLFDSATSDYDVSNGYGSVTGIVVEDGGVLDTDFVLPANLGYGRHRYLVLDEGEQYSSHRFYVGIGQFTLYPAKNGSFILRSMFLGDSVLTSYIEEYGMLTAKTNKNGSIPADTEPTTKALVAYGAGKDEAENQNHLKYRVYDVLNTSKLALWKEHTMNKYIKAQSYIQLKTGEKIVSAVVSMSFQDAVLKAQAQVDAMDAAGVKAAANEINALTNMYQQVVDAKQGSLLQDWSTSATRVPYYCLCGASLRGGDHALGCKEGCNEQPILWKPYNGLNPMVKDVETTYHFYLTQDYTQRINFNWSISSGSTIDTHKTTNFFLDLNGKNHILPQTSNDRVYGLAWKTNLWLCNSRPNEGGVIASKGTMTADTTVGSSPEHSGLFMMWSSNTESRINMMDGVTMKGADNANTSIYRGGIASLNAGGTFTMYGGRIEGKDLDASVTMMKKASSDDAVGVKTPFDSMGGAIYVPSGATFEMKGGTVTGGTAAIGGNIFVEKGGTFKMSGEAVVSDGNAINWRNANAGGNIYVGTATNAGSGSTNAVVEISGNAVISGGSSLNATYTSNSTVQGNGGNVWMNNGTFTVKDNAKVTGGSSRSNGGAFNVAGGTVVVMDNAVVAGNTASGGSRTNKAADIMLIGGNLNAYGGTIGYAYQYNASYKVNVQNDPQIYALNAAGKVTVNGPLTAGANIRLPNKTAGATAADITVTDLSSDQKAAIARAFVGAADGFSCSVNEDATAVVVGSAVVHCPCGAARATTDAVTHADGCNGEVVTWTKFVAGTSLTTAAGEEGLYYYLANDITGQSQKEVAAGLRMIDLNGYNYTADNASWGRMFITDDSTTTSNQIWLCNTAPYVETRGTISCRGVSGSNTGAIMLRNASDYLRILGNVTINATDNYYPQTTGGMINVNTGSVFDMYGGIITGGVANQGGGIMNKGTFNMYGGTITGNAANTGTDSSGGGIYSNGYLNIYGGSVTGNVATQTQNDDINLVNNKDANFCDATIGKVQVVTWRTTTAARLNIGGDTTIERLYISKGDTDTVTSPLPVIGVATDKDGNVTPLTSEAEINVNSSFEPALISRGTMTDDQWAAYRTYVDIFKPINANFKITFEADGIYMRNATDKLVHCVCGSNTAEHLGACDGFDHVWSPVTGTTFPITTGYYYIKDASIEYKVGEAIGAQNIYLDLNGLQTTIASNNRAFRFQGLEGGCEASVTFTDSKGGGKLISKASTNGNAQGILVWGYRPTLDTNGDGTPSTTDVNITFTMYGGHLDASGFIGQYSAESGAYSDSGAITLGDHATINLYGGKISGQTTAKGIVITIDEKSYIRRMGKGGAVYLDTDSTMNMYNDAEIIGGVAVEGGGAVYMAKNSQLNMYDNAKIHGGSIYQLKDNNIIYAASTSDGDTHGGNIFVSGGATLTLNDNASIYDGRAFNDGQRSNLTAAGASTRKFNNISAQGGNIYSNGTININATDKGTPRIYDGTCESNTTMDIFNVNGKINMNGGYVECLGATNTAANTTTTVITLAGAAEVDLLHQGASSGKPLPTLNVVGLTEGADIVLNGNAGTVLFEQGDMSDGDWATLVQIVHTYLSNGKANTIILATEETREVTDGDTTTTEVYNCIKVLSTLDAEGNPITYGCAPYACTGESHVNGCPTGAATIVGIPLDNATLKSMRGTFTASDSGYYYLTENLTHNTQIYFGTSETANTGLNVILDLNGYNIDAGFRALQIWNDAELTLKNTDVFFNKGVGERPEKGGLISSTMAICDPWAVLQTAVGYKEKKDADGNTVKDDNGKTVYLYDFRGITFPVVNMYEGVTLQETSGVKGYAGGCVGLCANSTFNMYGGTVIGNDVVDTAHTQGTCGVSGHTASGNYGYGGAFYIPTNATLNVYGGEIIGAYAEKRGGAICCNGGTVNLNNCTITGGSSAMGGAIYNIGTLSLNNVTIDGAIADEGDMIYSTTDISLDGKITFTGDISLGITAIKLGENLEIVNAFDVNTSQREGPITYGAKADAHVGKITACGDDTVLRNGKLCIMPTATSENQLLVGYGVANINPTSEQLEFSKKGYKDAYKVDANGNPVLDENGKYILTGYYPLAIQGYGHNPAGFITTDHAWDVIGSGSYSEYYDNSYIKISDPNLALKAIAIAYSDYHGDVIIMISVDSTSVDHLNTIKSEVSKKTGVPVDNIMISATHAHSTPAARNLDTFYDTDGVEHKLTQGTYYKVVCDGIVSAAEAAINDRKAVSNVEITTVNDVNSHGKIYNRVRNYISYDANGELLGMSTPNHYDYPYTSTATRLEAESEADDSVQLVRYTREGKTDIIVANFQTHPILFGTGGGTSTGHIHSDVVGPFRAELSAAYNNANVIYFSGAGGNINTTADYKSLTNGDTNYTSNSGEKGYERLSRWGAGLANVIKTYAEFETVPNLISDVSATKTTVTYNRFVDTEIEGCKYSLEERRAMAQAIKDQGIIKAFYVYDKDSETFTVTYNGVKYSAKDLIEDWKIFSYYHANVGLLSRKSNVLDENGNPPTGKLEIQAYEAGNIAFTAAPYEMFDTNGMELKTGNVTYNGKTYTNSNPFDMTIVATKTGNGGYIPSMIGYENGGYSTDISPYAKGTGEQMVTEFLSMLNGLKK